MNWSRASRFLFLAVPLTVSLLTSGTALASDQQCKSVFTKTKQTAARFAGGYTRLRNAISAHRAPIKAFDYKLFQSELALYRESQNLLRKPTTPEGELALFEASSTIKGRSTLHLYEWLEIADEADIKALHKALRPTSHPRGVRASTIEKIFTRIYLLNHSDPREFREVISRPIPDTLRALIIRRVEMELGAKGAREAFVNLGYARPLDRLDRTRNWILNKHPNSFEAATTAIANGVSAQLTGFIFLVAESNFLKAKKLTPHLKNRILNEGIDTLHPEFSAFFGHRAEGDLLWYWTRRALMLGLMAYFVSQTYEDVLSVVTPPGYLENEEALSKKGTLEIIEDVTEYWGWVGLNVYHLLFGDSSKVYAEPAPHAQSDIDDEELIDLMTILQSPMGTSLE